MRTDPRACLIAGSLACVLAAGHTSAGVKVWNTAADFADGVRYGVTATGTAPLTLGMRRTYDWNSCGCLDLMWSYWSSLPADVGESLDLGTLNHVAVVIGDRLYVIGGQAPSNQRPCGASADVTVSTVQTAQFQADGRLGPWFKCPLAFGQATEGDPAIPVYSAAAAVVGRRVYVSGGVTYVSTTDYSMGEKDLGTVYSAEPDPVTGMLGPWRKERAVLASGVFGHAMLYAGGALFVLGGNSMASKNLGRASFRTVQRADVRFDGTLYGVGN
ncbi:MAG: hypothetical protein AAB368_04005, partial [bacterium]